RGSRSSAGSSKTLLVIGKKLVDIGFQKRPSQAIAVELELEIIGAVGHGKDVQFAAALPSRITKIDFFNQVFFPVPQKFKRDNFPLFKNRDHFHRFINLFEHPNSPPLPKKG